MTQRLEYHDNFEKIRENLHFVLVEPEHPGNIGAVARALKTCGYKKLILVNPVDLNHPEIEWMAHRSLDIVEQARVCQTFDEAIAGMHLVAATTMRHRVHRLLNLSPSEVGLRLQTAALNFPVAIVFGRESNGLTNDEFLKCHLHTTILTAVTNPSLNLAQAVMIYANTFFVQHNQLDPDFHFDLASTRELEILYEHMQRAFDLVNFVPRDGMTKFMGRFKRFIGRSMPEKRDVRLLHKMLSIFEERIDVLENELSYNSKQDLSE